MAIQQTSLQSYGEILSSNKVSDRHDEIYRALLKIGEGTDREICYQLGQHDPNYVRPRRNELVKLGLVRQVCKRTCDITGKTAIVWKVEK